MKSSLTVFVLLIILCLNFAFPINNNIIHLQGSNNRDSTHVGSALNPLEFVQNVNKFNSIPDKPILISVEEKGNTYYTYSNEGKIIKKLTKRGSENNWVITEEEKYIYNENDLLGVYVENYEGSCLKTNYKYNSDNNLIEALSKVLISDYWQNYERYSYFRDSVGKVKVIQFDLPMDTNWITRYRETYSYNNSGYVNTEIHENYLNGSLQYDVKYFYEYNPSGKIISKIIQEYESNNWVNDIKYEYSYNISGKLIEVVTSEWENNSWVQSRNVKWQYEDELLKTYTEKLLVNNSWINLIKNTYTYNDFKKIIKLENEEFNYSGNLTSFLKTYFTYSDSNVTKSLTEQWLTGQGVKVKEINYQYNEYGYLSQALTGIWSSGSYSEILKTLVTTNNKGDVLRSYSYEKLGNKWIPCHIEQSICFNNRQDTLIVLGALIDVNYFFTASIKEEDNTVSDFGLSQNYPNPFNPLTKIEYTIPVFSKVTINVYNSLGEKVCNLIDEFKNPGKHEVTLDLSKHASGVYFCRLESGENISIRKIILLK